MSCSPTSPGSATPPGWRRHAAAALALAVGLAGHPGPLRAQTAGPAGDGWTLVIPRDQAIRMQRVFREVTPDAPVQGQMQFQQGVNPWAQLLIYAVAAAIGNKTGRDRAATADEVIVSTDASVGSAVAMTETATVKRFGTQEEASVALAPYAEALKGTTLHQLIGRDPAALQSRGLTLADGAPDTQRQVHVAPRFVFAADQRSVFVDASVGFGALTPEAAQQPDARQQALRVQVHSAAAGDAFDITEHWLKDDAAALRQTLAALVVTAVDIASARQRGSLSVPADAPQRTYRFRAGAESTYIRGRLIEATCSRVLLEALQGHWVAVPASSLRDAHLLPAECRPAG